MQEAPSLLSLAAAALYALVVLSSLTACQTARRTHQQSWHVRSWLIIAGIFILLIVSRVLNLEEILRADMRGWLRAEGMIAERRVFQGYIIAALILAFAAAGVFALYWFSRRIAGRRNICVTVAAASSGVMIVVIALRMISLHAMDRLLYGPLKLNWIGDIGASCAIIAAAVYYVQIVRRNPNARSR